jgi:hypothetical protein
MPAAIRLVLVLASLSLAVPAGSAEDVPAEYTAVLTALNKKGDFKDGVLKVNIPRSDLRVTIGGRTAPTPFGFGGWLAFTKGAGGAEVMMGDLVLTEDEVNPVMSALLDRGLDVTALHNHFFWEQPRIFYMHVHGMGAAQDLARRAGPAVRIIDQAAQRAPVVPPAPAASPAPGVSGDAVAAIIGHAGEQNGPVYKITIGRPDIDLRAHGAVINSLTGADADAMVAGDVAMLESEVTPVLKALRSNGIDVVAIHHHMTDVRPMVVFLHYFGRGPADRLARGVRAAVDQLGKPVRRAAGAKESRTCAAQAKKSRAAIPVRPRTATRRRSAVRLGAAARRRHQDDASRETRHRSGPEFDTQAAARRHGPFVRQRSRGHVFDGHARGVEDGDLLVRGPARFAARHDLPQLRLHVMPAHDTEREGVMKVSDRGGLIHGIDEHAAPGQEGRIDLLFQRVVRSHRGQEGPGTDVFGAHDRGRGRRARHHDVGRSRALGPCIGHGDTETGVRSQVGGERRRALAVAVVHGNRRDRADGGQGADLIRRLHSAAAEGHGRGLAPREESGRDRRGRGGS